MTATRKPGRPADRTRTSVYVAAPRTEIEAWRRAAKRMGLTLNMYMREAANRLDAEGERR